MKRTYKKERKVIWVECKSCERSFQLYDLRYIFDVDCINDRLVPVLRVWTFCPHCKTKIDMSPDDIIEKLTHGHNHGHNDETGFVR